MMSKIFVCRHMNHREKYIVYQILGDDEVVLYVGVTKRKLERLTREHFTSNGHLDPSCYHEAQLILYFECISKEDAFVREKYLIKTSNPRFNGTHNKPGIFSFDIPFDWQYFPVDKSRLDTPSSPRSRRHRVRVKHAIPSFEVLKEKLAVSLSLDCSRARIEGPDPALTWFDGEKLAEMIDAQWTACGSPGLLYASNGANLACEGLSLQDWVGHTRCDSPFDDAGLLTTRPHVAVWGAHGNRVPWLKAGDDHAVLNELAGFTLPWHATTGMRSLVGTFATVLDVSVRLYNWRDSYVLTLAYLSEVLNAGARFEDRCLFLTCNLELLLHDWFLHQSHAAGYEISISGVDVQPWQKAPLTVMRNGKRDEVESRWYREAFLAGRGAARRFNQTVWVYSLTEIRGLEVALNVELNRLMDGATDVRYHNQPFAFQNYYQTSRLDRETAPKLLVLD
ncbi:GIY-YIG nuclease family protein [Paraburkholderia sediminicola]|uniref:GIY-YIG nuclease family protein n=1 Tax=Paraburkholderia sediminicola TaxID=458836 RepID=UPI0038BDB248